MKQIQSLPLFFLLFSSLSFAQGMGGWDRFPGPPEDRAFPGPRMEKELQLTQKQIQDIATIREAAKPETKKQREAVVKAQKNLQEALQKDTPDQELLTFFEGLHSARSSMARENFNTMLKIRKILTPEQRTKLNQWMGPKTMKGKRPRGKGQGWNDTTQ